MPPKSVMTHLTKTVCHFCRRSLSLSLSLLNPNPFFPLSTTHSSALVSNPIWISFTISHRKVLATKFSDKSCFFVTNDCVKNFRTSLLLFHFLFLLLIYKMAILFSTCFLFTKKLFSLFVVQILKNRKQIEKFL